MESARTERKGWVRVGECVSRRQPGPELVQYGFVLKGDGVYNGVEFTVLWSDGARTTHLEVGRGLQVKLLARDIASAIVAFKGRRTPIPNEASRHVCGQLAEAVLAKS